MKREALSIVLLLSLQACAAYGQTTIGTLTLYTKLDKPQILPGESVIVEVWCKLEPGVGAKATYTNPVGTWDAEVHAFAFAYFNIDLKTRATTKGWGGIIPHPDLDLSGAPSYNPYSVGEIELGLDDFKITQDDPIRLCTTLWTPNQYVAGQTAEFSCSWITGGAVLLWVPALNSMKGVTWIPELGQSSVLQIVPAPSTGTLAILGTILAARRRRR